jgi:protein O-mannosyl-transferase
VRQGSIALLLIAVAATYFAALPHGFVYDDHGSIEENTFLKDPANLNSVLSLRTVTDPTVPDGRRPLVILSYFLDQALWGLKPIGYHLTNIFLHLSVVVLVFALVTRLSGPSKEPFLSFAAALLFGLHPVLTEVVNLPAYREDLVVSAFLLLYLLAAARGTDGWRQALLSTVALTLALASKESAAVAPALLLWLWICFPATRARRPVRLLGPHALIVAVFAVLWLRGGPLHAALSSSLGRALRFPTNLLTAPWLWFKAVRMLAWPHPLLADYVVNPVSEISDTRFWVGAGALLASAAASLSLIRRRPWISLGLGWMLLGFLPVCNLVPLYNPFAERYLYFLAIGFAILLAHGLSRIMDSPRRAALLAAAAAAYAGLSVFRLADWADDYTLWSRTLACEPRSSRAHTWLGLELKHRGSPEKALEEFLEADRLNPYDVTALINIGILYGEQDRLADAEAVLREAVRRRPDKADTHGNLSVALRAEGKNREAAAEASRTLEMDPGYPLPGTTRLALPPAEKARGNPVGDSLKH